ncbi:hypothetical protein O3G_MSEX000423 [Manduca sexta]|nr:hypothetical protein O3G_MSEX000423 [Manduca sexta]
MTPGLIRCSKHKDLLHSRVRKNPKDETIKLIYTRYRNFYGNIIRKLKQNYDTNKLEESKHCPKQLWDTIKNITYTKITKQVPLELTQTKDSVIKSLDYCNNYFSSVGKQLANNILSTSNETQDSLARKVAIDNTPLQSLFLDPTDEEEIKSLIVSLKPSSAPGLDGMSNRLLYSIQNHIIMPLTFICNLSLSQGIFPSAWKMAAVTPIHKSGDKSEPSNYRPISLLGPFSKILEKLMHKRLIKFLDEHNILSERQFGFRVNKSTENAVDLTTKIIVEQLDKKQACIGVFLDLSKAFDTVCIPILLRKL